MKTRARLRRVSAQRTSGAGGVSDTLLDLFRQLREDPDRLPEVPVSRFPEGSDGRRLMEEFGAMLERLAESKKSLRESAERFDLAVQGANDGLWDWDLRTDVVYFSPRWKGMLGYSDEEIPNRYEEWYRLVHTEDRERALASISDHFAGLTPYYQIEHRLLHKDGAYRWILARGIIVRDAKGEPYRMAGSHTDITERKKADEALRISENRFRGLFEQSPFAIHTYAPDGYSLEVNDAWARIYGIEPDEMAGYNVLEDPEIKRQGVLLYVQRVFAGEALELPSVYNVKEGSNGTPAQKRWIRAFGYPIKDSDGSIREVVFVVEDITRQKEAEERLREQEEQYRGIFEATSDGLVINSLQGQVVEVNPAFCEMHGYTREEMLKLSPTDFIHPDSHPLFKDFIATVSKGGYFQAQAVDIRKDGTPFHVEVHGTSFTYKGEPHILGVVRDTTERVQAYQLLEQRVEERTRELSTILEVSHTVASTLELKSLVGVVLDQLKYVADYSGASILILEGEQLVMLDSRASAEREEEMLGREFPIERMGIVWEALLRREAVIIPDVRADTPLARAYRETAADLLDTTFKYISSWLAVPLALKDRVIGLLGLSHREPDYYTPRHARLAMAIANQAAVAIENAQLYAQAQVTARNTAALEERQRLARELHDSVSQAIFSIALHARTSHTLLERDPTKAIESLEHVSSLSQAAMAEMRALIFELRPESLENEGLIAALTKQTAATRARHGVEVTTKLCSEPDLPLAVKEAVYRIAQEALHNTVKHARATHVELTLSCDDEEIALEIRDNGVGFDAAGAFPGHLGLRSMHERASRVGGTLHIRSAPDKGTTISLKVPVQANEGAGV